MFATVPQEKWDQGPAAANRWIRERLNEIEPPLDLAEIAERLKQDPHGAAIEIVDGRARIAPDASEDDATAAEHPQTIQLHERARLRAAAARDRVQRLSNQHGFESIAVTVDEFARFLSSDTLSVAANISTVWELSTAIGTFIERDDEVKAGRGGLTPPMDADAREALDQLSTVAAVLVRRFPTAREHDEAFRISRQPREAIEPAKRIVEKGKTADLVEAHTGNVFDAAIAAAVRGDGVQAERSRWWTGKSTRNMVIGFVMVTVATGFLSKAGEDLYDHLPHMPSSGQIREFLLDITAVRLIAAGRVDRLFLAKG